MDVAGRRRETLTPRTGVERPGRPEDTAGGRVAEPTATRRDLLKWGLIGSLLATLGGGLGAFLFYFYPKKTSPFGGKITMQGTLADYPEGTVERVREGKFYLSHLPEGLIALYWRCAHLGCTVPWKPEEEFQGQTGVFHCPCHGSIYLRSGQNVAGPAPRPLAYMAIELQGDRIVIDTGKRTERVRHEAKHATPVP